MKRKNGAYRIYKGFRQARVRPVPSTDLWEVAYRDDTGHWGVISATETRLDDAKALAHKTLGLAGRNETETNLIARIKNKIGKMINP